MPLAASAQEVVRRAVTSAAKRREHQAEIRRLETAPWASPTAMDSLRLDRLRTTVARAAARSPFYREVLHGVAPDLRSLEDLRAVPVTSKVQITDSGLQRAAPGSALRPRTTWRTSGSSGVPFVFEIDVTYGSRHDAQRAFVYKRAGLPPGSRIVEILGFANHLHDRRQLSYPTFRRTVIGYGREDLTAAIFAASPSLLYGNRSHLLAIADEVVASGIAPGLQLVCSSSETLHPADRQHLVTSLGAPVLEVYGSAEASNIAFRLPGDDDWTTLEPRILVEVLGPDREPVGVGETGEIVVTTLTEPTSPLVRYATGDLAKVSAGSATGASGLRLASLEGRVTDALVGADGRRVPFWDVAYAAFWAADEVARHVRRWRIDQHADRAISVSLQLAERGDVDAVTPLVLDHLRSKVGELPISVAAVAELHDPAAGKFRAVTSTAVPTH